jgi:hypothetical protein
MYPGSCTSISVVACNGVRLATLHPLFTFRGTRHTYGGKFPGWWPEVSIRTALGRQTSDPVPTRWNARNTARQALGSETVFLLAILRTFGEPGRTRTCNPLIKSSIPEFCTVLDLLACGDKDELSRASRLTYTTPSKRVPATVSATFRQRLPLSLP